MAALAKKCLVIAAIVPLLALAQQQAPNINNGAYANRQAQQQSNIAVTQGQSQPQNAAQGLPAGGPKQPSPMPSPLPARDLVQDALDQSAPLSQDEIRKFLGELIKRNQTTMENHTGRPAAKPVTSIETLDLTPGAPPPVVRVAMGQGVTISFSDAAGRPWVIADNLNFNASAYEVKLIGPHLYTIKLNRPAAANITIVLKDLPRPIVITALPATDEADYLKEFTVPRFIDGVAPPSVAAGMTTGALALNAPELLNYLYRTPPPDAKALGVVGLPGVMVWQNTARTMVVRTAGLVVIPGWLRRHSSTDGVSVYEVPLSAVMTVAQDGLQHRLSVTGFTVPNGSVSSTQ